MKRLIIYDMQEKLTARNEDILFSANPVVKPCMGCFNCWIKTPGKCVIDDRCTVIPSYIAQCDEMLFISPLVYGGYSPAVKAVIDRSIPYILPYFRIVGNEMHHKMRYEKRFKLTAYFYGSCNDEEKNTARRLVAGNAVNFGAENMDIKFFDTAEKLTEAVL